MTSAPSNAGSVCPNTCEKPFERRSPKLVLSGCCIGCQSPGCCSLVPRPSLHIEDHASTTRRTDQPLAFARVSKAERSAADASCRHRRRVARTYHRLSARICLAHATLLVGIEPGNRVAHDPLTESVSRSFR